MRIACYYGDLNTHGRNDGGPIYFCHNLRKIFGKENVVHLFPSGDLSMHGNFDLHWLTDFGEDALNCSDFELPHPSVYITSDTHLGYEYRLARAKRCDWVFCNQQKAQQDFIRDGIPAGRCFWLPHAFDPLAYSKGSFDVKTNRWVESEVIKKYDVCFIGNLNDENRVRHLDRLFKEFHNFHWSCKRFHEAAEIYNQSRIVFNVSSRGELNMRVFEALGSGSFLLTDKIEDSQDVLKSGVHYGSYGNMDEMIQKAHYYLDHDEERERIAWAGHKSALESHTYAHRVAAVLEKIGLAEPVSS